MTTHREPLESVLETVGETPMVRVGAAPEAVPVYAKLESFNPGASIKDRIGVYMCEQLLEQGDLEPGGTIIEPTAGNTGIGMALAASQLDLEATFVVPERFSVEKQDLMAALGAEIVNTPTEEGIEGAIERAHELAAETEGAIVPQQFSNPLNAEAHYRRTAPEIYEALDDSVGAIVIGCGSCGTLMGIAEYALERYPDTHVVAVQPEGSMFDAFLGADPEEASYTTEGIGTHNPSRNDLFDPAKVDDLLTIGEENIHAEMQRLAKREGQLVASSSAANSIAAQRVAEGINSGEIDAPYGSVVTVFPDSSERYLSKDPYGSFHEWKN